MKRIDRTFKRLRQQGRGALIPFLMSGDPDQETSFELAAAAADSGADILELGIPFSDPVADGPVIQRAGQRALASGMNLSGVMHLVRRLRAGTDIPLVLMTYYNPVYRHGEERFVDEAAAAGADGLIVVDLPPEEGGSLFRKARRAGLAVILLVAPTTPPEREAMILRSAGGFIYCVSRPGTTGARADIPTDLRGKVAGLKAKSRLPVAVGFGISTRGQVAEILSFADAAVVGSALVAAAESAPPDGAASSVRRFLEELRPGKP